MFLRLLYQSFLRQRRRKLLAGVAIMLGMTVATAMISVGVDVGDKINRELRSYGANIVVYPQEDTLDVDVGGVNVKPVSQGAYLKESDLVNIKHIFWAHNIIGYSPMLSLPVSIGGTAAPAELIGTYFAKPIQLENETITTGVTKTHPWWKVDGQWPDDAGNSVLVGRRLANNLKFHAGDLVYLANHETKISGILSTGGAEEDAIVAPLALAQKIANHPGAVRRVYVSALTKPEDDFARRDPRSMSPDMLERWSCSPYANSIAYQIQEALPNARAEQIRQVAQNEGVLLSRISGLMLLVTLAALGAAVLAVSAAMATTIFERRREIGLMKSLGANNGAVVTLFLSEAGLLAIAGGVTGFLLGAVMAQRIGIAVFNSRVEIQPVLFPVVLLLAILVTFVGSAASIRRALTFDPAVVLRGDAT
ncbi:MAG: efflux pump, inner rane subunit [Acidobacteriaceae bacterium]|nr:efflux pump, inner rane subunit [Acidobacteriaceae bacterium]